MSLCPQLLMDMVAPMLPLQGILELEGLCKATRVHSTSSSFWARVATTVNPRFQLPECLQVASCASTVKELTLLLLAVAAPAPALQLETAAEARGLMDKVRRAKQRVSESRASHARQLTVDYCEAARRQGAQLFACRLRFQELPGQERLLGARWTVALRQGLSLRLEAVCSGAELQVRGLCAGAPQLSFELCAASGVSLQLRGRATSSGAVGQAVVLAVGDVGAALREGVLCVLCVQARPRAAEPPKSAIPSLQLSAPHKATEASPLSTRR